MGTQRDIAAQIIDQGGDYILALKGNQGKLHKGVETFSSAAQKTQWEGIELSYSECTQAGHHRIEHRQVWAVPISQLPDLPNRAKWKGLTSVVMVKRERHLWNQTTTEVCFYITSLATDARVWRQRSAPIGGLKIASIGWRDVTFREDHSRIRSGHGPENMGLLRRL